MKGKQTPNKKGEEAAKEPKRVLMGARNHAPINAHENDGTRARGNHPVARPHRTSPRGRWGTSALALKCARGLTKPKRMAQHL